jgi:hypothetical protein
MNNIDPNAYLGLVNYVQNPMPDYVDVHNLDQDDYTTSITTGINIFVTRNAGLIPKDHFFSMIVNRLSAEGHVTNQVAISLLSTRMMNGNQQNRMPFQGHPPPMEYNYPPNLGQQHLPNYNFKECSHK